MKINTCSSRPILQTCRLENFDYQIDAYVGCGHLCHYCYVLNQAETDWREEILIHHDLEGQLQTELAPIAPQKIYFGYHTDPYQPCEAEYRQTRNALRLLRDRGFSASILTKSDLVLRDVDILKAMPDASVSVSVAFNDNDTRRLFEANTIDTEPRIAALRQLRAAGIGTGALVCPVIPYITDAALLIDMLAPHTDAIWIYGLSIEKPTDPNWHNLQELLERHFPDLKTKIESAIFSKDHPFWTALREDLQRRAVERGLNLKIHV